MCSFICVEIPQGVESVGVGLGIVFVGLGVDVLRVGEIVIEGNDIGLKVVIVEYSIS